MSLSAAYRRDLARAAWSGGLAITMTGSVLVAGSLLPTAAADHGGDPLTVDQNITSCAQIADLPGAEPHGPFNPVTENNDDLTEGLHEFNEATVEVIFDDGEAKSLDVTPEPGFEITAVAVKGTPQTNVYFGEPFENLVAPDSGAYEPAEISHYTVCFKQDDTTQELDAVGECVGSVPYLAYSIDDADFDEPVPDGGLTVTFEHPSDPTQDRVATGLDGEGQVLWPGAEVDEEGNGTDWPGWVFEDGSWVQADDGFEWVRPSVNVIFGWESTTIETEVQYPDADGQCNPPPGEEGESVQLSILEPICDDDVPYLQYMIEPEGFTPDDVSITWINPDGEDVVYEDLPLSGTVLWAGAVAGPDGEPLDWPGWIQLEDGTWIEGDDGFAWVRPSVDVRFEVNPEQTLTVPYPPSSPDCAAEPPQGELPETGSNATLGFAGAGLLLGGLVLMLLGRRRMRNNG